MLDPNFPARLLKSGHQRTMEFIHFLSEEYSKRGLTNETDRCVAIYGLMARIARARECQSRYGIFKDYLHRNILWQRSDGKMKRIMYETPMVPSWSWMAYNGGIQFMEIPYAKVDWNENIRFNNWIDKLRFEKHKYALVADICVFRDCGLEQRDTNYTIVDSSKAERGQIRYDVEASEDLHAERCVVVGKESQRYQTLTNWKYYILVVRQSSVDGEYRRVGAGWIQKDYIARHKLNVRVV
jgi:hypothetical protein